jgi:hypothetical protein
MPAKDIVAWLLFTASLPGRSQSTPRVRLWRALKELSAATLRDGVTVVPATDDNRAKLQAIGKQVEEHGGNAWLLELAPQRPAIEQRLRVAFDRKEAYAELQAGVTTLRSEFPRLDEASTRQRLRQLQRAFEAVAEIDFFPGDANAQASAALEEIAEQLNRRYSPREPAAAAGQIPRLDVADYRKRVWATRRRLWVDRVASAWLVHRFIDAEARFVWLDRPEGCPEEALGFDFDDAAFTHVGERVTFEVLLASFGLDANPGLDRLGQLVHFLDVGSGEMPEAAGFEAVLAGLRDSTSHDDALLAAMTPVLNGLYQRYSAATT